VNGPTRYSAEQSSQPDTATEDNATQHDTDADTAYPPTHALLCSVSSDTLSFAICILQKSMVPVPGLVEAVSRSIRQKKNQKKKKIPSWLITKYKHFRPLPHQSTY
jgi:hypothetical protein